DRLLLLYRRGFPAQDQEGRLEGVLGIVFAVQNLQADAQDHRTVAMNERGKCLVVAGIHEAIQQRSVGQSNEGFPCGQITDEPKNSSFANDRHRLAVCKGYSFLLYMILYI